MRYSKESSKYNVRNGWEHRCVVCGDVFQCRSKYGKYCSQRCANDAAIARRKLAMNARREQAVCCKVCGNPIAQNPLDKIRLYCSAACKQRAYRARKGAQSPRVPL